MLNLLLKLFQLLVKDWQFALSNCFISFIDFLPLWRLIHIYTLPDSVASLIFISTFLLLDMFFLVLVWPEPLSLLLHLNRWLQVSHLDRHMAFKIVWTSFIKSLAHLYCNRLRESFVSRLARWSWDRLSRYVCIFAPWAINVLFQPLYCAQPLWRFFPWGAQFS